MTPAQKLKQIVDACRLKNERGEWCDEIGNALPDQPKSSADAMKIAGFSDDAVAAVAELEQVLNN